MSLQLSQHYIEKFQNQQFIVACITCDFQMMESMVFDKKITYNQEIKNILHDSTKEYYVKGLQMFEKRELNKKLNKDLKHHIIVEKIQKV